MPTSQPPYTARLEQFRSAIASLPSKLPSNSLVYDFSNWSPDPQLLEDYGAPCSVLNATLESTFGLRGQSQIVFTEKGPGLESLADILEHYLTGDYIEQVVIGKWLDDLTEAAENMTLQHNRTGTSKRVLKPSAAQKRTNDWIETTREEKNTRKKQKVSAAAKVKERAIAIEKTAQSCNWRYGFDDLIDIKTAPKAYTTGRKGYSITKELYIKCRSSKTGGTRYRCSSKGCQQSWSSAQAQRLFAHITSECSHVDPELLERVSEQSANISLGQQALDLRAADSELELDSEDDVELGRAASKAKSGISSTQSTLRTICKKEGLRAQQVHFDLSIVNFVSAAQIAPRKIDMPEFHAMISKANPQLKLKSSSTIAHSHIPMESCRIRRLALEELRRCEHLTISFDGGTAIRPVSFTTIHVTTPETRVPHLMHVVEASGIPHTGKFYFEELDKILKEIGPHRFSGITCDSTGNTRLARELIHAEYPNIIVLPDPCHQLHNAAKDIAKLEYFNDCRSTTSTVLRYFSKSSQGARHLESTRQQMGITMGLKKHSKTRFAGVFHSTFSTRKCLPAIERVVKSGVIDIKKDHALSFVKNVSAYSKFSTELYQLEKLLEPIAKAIQCLELGHSNPSDVLIFYLAVVAAIRQYVDSDELGLPPHVLERAQAALCARFQSMVLAAGQEVYLATFFVHPRYLNSDILRRHNLNPLNTNTIRLPARQPSKTTSTLPDADISQAIPSFPKIAVFLKAIFCLQLAAGAIGAARDYPSTEEGVNTIIELFKFQVTAYARNEYPFKHSTSAAEPIDPMKFWKKLLKHPDACFLAPVAIKLFSLVPNSMAEERTVSCFSRMNSKDQSCQKISTLMHMTRIRQHLLRTREKQKPVHKPVVKFRDLSTSVLKQHASVFVPKESNTQVTTKELSEGWSVDDTEKPKEGSVDGATDEEPNADDEDQQEEYESDDEDPEPVDRNAIGFNPSESYGADLSSPVLLDLLSDAPVPNAELDSSAHSVRKPSGATQQVKSAAKKDVSSVDTL